MRGDQVEQSLLLGFCPLPVASLRGHAQLAREPPASCPRVSRHCHDSCDQRLQADLCPIRLLPGRFGRRVQIRSHHFSRRPRPAVGTTIGLLIQFPHVPQRLWKPDATTPPTYTWRRNRNVSHSGLKFSMHVPRSECAQRFSSTPIMDRGILLGATWQSGLDSMFSWGMQHGLRERAARRV